jgi:hypothetical protein
MSVLLDFLIAAAVVTPFAISATAAARARRAGHLRWHADQFRFAAPMTGQFFTDDADFRRVGHDTDAIRTRFETQPSWPGRVDASAVRHERR